MAKRTVEMEDNLPDRVDSAIDDVKQELLNYLEQNPDTDEVPCLNNDLDYSGTIHEIVDGTVPIYTKEIDDTYYLYGRELDEAYENAGIGDGKEENHIQVCIYCYIMEKVQEWYSDNAEEVFDEWRKQYALKKAATFTLEQCAEALALALEGEEIAGRTVEDLRGELLEKLEAGDVTPDTVICI